MSKVSRAKRGGDRDGSVSWAEGRSQAKAGGWGWPRNGLSWGRTREAGVAGPRARGSDLQAVRRRGPGSEARGNIEGRRELEGREAEKQKSKLRSFLGGKLGMVRDWRGREEQANVEIQGRTDRGGG